MKKLTLTLGLALGLATAVQATPYETGWAAYQAKDYATALTNFQQAAATGDAQAQLHLGILYYNGWGTPSNYALASQWFLRAAAQGVVGAQTNLGVMYARGKGVPQDALRAYVWSTLAADQGDASAAANRNLAQTRLTPAQWQQAQQWVRQCESSHYQACL